MKTDAKKQRMNLYGAGARPGARRVEPTMAGRERSAARAGDRVSAAWRELIEQRRKER